MKRLSEYVRLFHVKQNKNTRLAVEEILVYNIDDKFLLEPTHRRERKMAGKLKNCPECGKLFMDMG